MKTKVLHAGGCGTCSPIALVNSTTVISPTASSITPRPFQQVCPANANRVYSSNAQGIVTAAFVNPAPD